MNSGFTSMGGDRGDFPRTTLGLFSRLRNPGDPGSGEALETLCRRYWKPVYCYLRYSKTGSNEEAKDLTQGFFGWLVEDEALKRYAPERGSFRNYLKVLLNGFAANRRKSEQRLKRGGGATIVPLDADAGLRDLVPDPSAADPERAFDIEWLRGLIDGAVSRVRARFESTGRAAQFRAYEMLEMSPSQPPLSQAAAAQTLGIAELDVRHALFAVREAIRAEMRAELAETTADPRELEKEWNELFGG